MLAHFEKAFLPKQRALYERPERSGSGQIVLSVINTSHLLVWVGGGHKAQHHNLLPRLLFQPLTIISLLYNEGISFKHFKSRAEALFNRSKLCWDV